MLDPSAIERVAEKAGEAPIIVALSGGGDSVALLHLMCEAFGADRVRAVVVDHALRVGSDADARKAADFARKLEVEAEIATLNWDVLGPSAFGGPKPRSHEAAREARYLALCAAARRSGARVIATGHTRDDQAETVLLRAERGSGWRGLAGMRALAPVPFWPEGRALWLARPLLGARRGALRTYLREHNGAWVEDPANENEVYARVRARRTLGALEAAGFDPMRLAVLAERLTPHAVALDEAAAALIVSTVAFEADVVVFDFTAWRSADAEVRMRALAVLITAAGAHARGPAAEQVAELNRALAASNFDAATLAGALVRKRHNRIELARDRGALGGRADGAPGVPPVALPVGVEAVWDGRVSLRAPDPGWSVVVEDAAPILARAEERAPLAHASPHWLVKERVQHVLGVG